MDGREMMQVRDLRGEDLERLAASWPSVRIRFLVEIGEVLAASGDADVLVISTGDAVCAAAAAGYHAPFGDARVVTARGLADHAALRRLLADVEARSVRHRCLTLVSTVDVLDEAARRAFELLGWVVTGAGVTVWSERTTPGEPECSVDTWTVRKDIVLPGQRGPGPSPPRGG
ncbi:MAG TPA: hypothetical protein VGH76_10110 [Actinomycetospora sp.]|uniref:hypothetical protein n=1 Tax=Actinomycetospora sp. TaxID=1872135 RepID=UPI002F40AC3B